MVLPVVEGTITLRVGEDRLVTVTITNEDGTAFDGSGDGGYAPAFFVRRDGASANHIDGKAMSWLSGDPSTGVAQVRVGDVAGELDALPTGVDVFKGLYSVRLTGTTEGYVVWTEQPPFIIRPNRFV